MKHRRTAMKVITSEGRRIVWHLRLLQLGAWLSRDTKQLAEIRELLAKVKELRRDLRARASGRPQ